MHLAVNAYFWNQPNTGSGQYTRQLVYNLNRYVSDIDITLIFPTSDAQTNADRVPPNVQVEKVAVKQGQTGKVLFEQNTFPRACRDIGANLAHVPYWGGPLRSPVPLALTIHDLTTILIPEYARGLKPRLYNALVSASARGAGHIITDSFASKLDIVDHLEIAERDITAIYLAAGPQFSSKEDMLIDMAIRKKYDLPDFFTLYLGGYALHKNISTLLRAYRYVAQAMGEDYPLLLAGRKPEIVSTNFPDYEAIINKLGLEKFVRWIGYIDEEDKPALYRSAETFIFPSRYEGFGLGPLEAMACGTPVVTTDSASLPEVVESAAFTVDPDNARDMAGAIIATLVQDNLRAELRQKGLEQAKKFSWQQTAVETALVYDQILRG